MRLARVNIIIYGRARLYNDAGARLYIETRVCIYLGAHVNNYIEALKHVFCYYSLLVALLGRSVAPRYL